MTGRGRGSSGDGASLRLVLIGRPVARSRSPELFHGLDRHGGPHVSYELLDAGPDELPRALEDLRRGRWDGANVTVPHKIAAARLVEDLDGAARSSGAINVVSRSDGGGLTGANTDGAGFLAALDEAFPRFEPGRAVVCGTGGAARAVAAALAPRGWPVTFVSRATGRPRLSGLREAGPGGRIVEWGRPELGEALSLARLVVQATPLGSSSREGESVPLPWGRLPATAVAVDLVYEPWETPFLREARRRGIRALNGWPMLVRQAAASLSIWADPDSGAAVVERGREIETRDPLQSA